MEGDSLAQYKTRVFSMRRLLLGKAKLKASSRTSALLSGFAMVAMVEIQLRDTLPESILVTFSIITTLVVAMHLLALMISTCILPHLEAVSEMHTLVLIHESPHDHFYWYIEIAWFLSTGIGIFLFLAQMAMLAWVRFYDLSQSAHVASTAIILPVIVIFIAFAVHFHRKLITVKCQNSTRGIVELERLANDLEAGQCSDDKNKSPNKYANTQFKDTQNNSPYFKDQHNLYNISQFSQIIHPDRDQLMIQNVNSPLNLSQNQFGNNTQWTLNRNKLIDEKVHEMLNDSKEIRTNVSKETANKDLGKNKNNKNASENSNNNINKKNVTENEKNVNERTNVTENEKNAIGNKKNDIGNKKNVIENDKNVIEKIKNEGSQLLNRQSQLGKTDKFKTKSIFSKFLKKKQPPTNTILDL